MRAELRRVVLTVVIFLLAASTTAAIPPLPSSFYGRVTEIASAAQIEGDRRILRVRTMIENNDGMLRPGMTGNAKIYCGKRSLWSLASRRAIRYVRTEFLF